MSRPFRVLLCGILFAALSSASAFASLPSGMLSSNAFGKDLAVLREESRPCFFCHVQGSYGPAVYADAADSYLTPSDHAHSELYTPCLACHVPHGEAGMGGALASKRLRVRKYQREVVRELGGGDSRTITDGTARAEGWRARGIQLTAFCSSCHPVYASSSEQTIVMEELDAEGEPRTAAFRRHPLTAATSRATGKRLAAKDSTGCRSCHDAGSGGDFPHSTPNEVFFLTSAAGASDTPAAPDSNASDGVCLRCHRWKDATGTRGVGVDW